MKQSKTETKITMDEWMEGVTAAYKQERPKNSFTMAEFTKKRKLTRSIAARIVNELIESGKVERMNCMVNNRVTPIYVIKDKSVG